MATINPTLETVDFLVRGPTSAPDEPSQNFKWLGYAEFSTPIVIPAQAGTQGRWFHDWIPACAATTNKGD